MDGLLFDSEALLVQAGQEASRAFNLSLPESFFHQLIGTPAHESKERLGDYIRETSPPDFQVQALLQALWDEWGARFNALRPSLALKPGVYALLDYCDQQNLVCAIATSSSRKTAQANCAVHDLRRRFACLITRDDCERAKPDPEPFLRAAQGLGVDPAVCLALEDSWNGVRAAASAGMMTIMVPDLLPATAEMRDLCVMIAADLHEVAARMEQCGL